MAEARILVRPDTSKFRAELEAALATATKPITIPVKPVVVGGLSAATASTEAFTSAQAGAAAQTQAVAAAMEKETIAATRLSAAQTGVSKSSAGIVRGAGSAGLTLFGLRGATLAASGAFLAGTAAVSAFAKSLQSAAALETELNVFRVTAGATADQMERVSAAAKALGRDITLPGVTAGDAATAMTELAKAGLSVEDSLNGARGALQLATAAQVDNVTATKLIAGALNAFSLSGNEAVHVADLLTGAANASQGEIADMGTALGQASAVAHTFGVSLEDTVTILTELAQAGIEGGRAGTSFRVAMLRLVNPTAKAAAILKDLGVQVRDVNGNLRPQVFFEISEALQKYSVAQQQAKLATIGGSDAIRTFAILGAKGAEGFNATSEAVNQFGLAQQQAAARTSGLQGALENLSNQFSSLGTSIGEASSGPVKSLVNNVASLVSGLNDAAGGAADLASALDELDRNRSGGFFDKLGKELTGSPIPEITAFVKLLSQGEPVKFGQSPTETLRGLEEAKVNAAKIREDIIAAVNAGKQTGGELGLNQTLNILDALIKKLNEGGPASQKFASEIAKIRTELQQGGTKGFKLFPDDVTELFPPDLLSGAVSRKVGETNRDALEQALSGRDLFSFTKASFDNVTRAIVVAGNEAAEAARKAFAAVVRAATEELAKIDEQIDVAVAGGSREAQLAALRKRAAELQEQRDAADAAAKAIGAGNKGFATAVKKRREAQAALAATNEQIRSIEDQIAADAEKTAQDIITSRNKADQAFLDSVSGRATDLQNAVLAAASTKGLADDIKRNVALRDFFVQSRAQAAKTIKDAKASLQAIRAYTTQIIQINNTIDGLVQQQIESQNQARIDRQERIKESANLDISLAQTTGNENAEINARKRLIAELKREQALVKAGTNEWKKLRNDIAAENAAIAELTAEKKKQGQSFAQASFEFLQTQQGFASNLLGNLIPSGATAGLVGGQTPVQDALTPVAGFADGQAKSGPTAGQAQTTNGLLGAILIQLKHLNGDNSAPEAQRQNRAQRAVMDGVGGG